jgi:hypothetical protein
MPNVTMLSVVMLGVVKLSVVAPHVQSSLLFENKAVAWVP